MPNLLLPTNEAISEHSAYLPSMGIVTTTVWTSSVLVLKWRRFPERFKKTVLSGIGIAILVTLALLTLNRNQVWRNPVTLWNDVLQKNPLSSRAMINLGTDYLYSGQIKQAQTLFTRATDLKPESVEAWNNLGISYGLQGNHIRALEMFQKALLRDPVHVDTLNNLGTLSIQDRSFEAAIATLSRALEIYPNNPNILGNLGHAYIKSNKTKIGCQLIHRSLDFDPDNTRNRYLVKEFCR